MNSITTTRIKELRERKGLSQHGLAEALQINQQTISKYELGTVSPQIDNLIKYADFFGCTIDYLIGRDDVEMTDGYSLEEKRMIIDFRALPETLQQNIKGIITAFVKRYEKNSTAVEVNTDDKDCNL